MKISVELNEDEIRKILVNHLNKEFGLTLATKDLHIEVKSKQNYKSEWEIADIRIKQEIIQPPR
jgi:hypothetical protein